MTEWLVVVLWLIAMKLIGHLIPPSFHGRKLLHILVGVSVIPLAHYIEHWYVAAVPLTLILAANAHSNLKQREAGLSTFHKKIFPVAGFVLPLIFLLLLWRAGRQQTIVLAVLAMSFGDAAAAWFGTTMGKHRVSWSGKSIEGAFFNLLISLAVLFAANSALYAATSETAATLAAAAVVGAVAELCVPGMWDNPVVLTAIASVLLLI